jgi:hypothetical protein
MRRLLDYRSKKKSTTKVRLSAGLVLHTLTHRQTPAEPSATSASAEPAATVVYGLQVVCEGINPIVEYAFLRRRPSHS